MAGCPVCRMELQSVIRHLENQLYENVNSPRWRERLRASLGFCHEHAWLAVDRRLGDALGFAIIYRDLVSTLLNRLEEDGEPVPASRHWALVFRQVPEQARAAVGRLLQAVTPGKRCPVCEHREEVTRTILSALVNGLKDTKLVDALHASEGLCLPHLQKSLEQVRDGSASETLLAIHRRKLDRLLAELEEFIRKNDYQAAGEGFGGEGDAWLRAVALIVGVRKGM